MKPNTTETIKQNLTRYHLFSKLTDLQLDKVCQFSQLQQLADGQEKIIDIVKSGQVFAEALMFNERESYPVSSAALCETTVIAVNAKNFHDMLWDSTGTCILLLSDMSFRLRKLINEIETLTLHSGTCRVASYLIHEMPEQTKNFELDTAKNIIAARLSIKPETFSRIIKNLSTQGILTISGNHVSIHDIDALKQKSIKGTSINS